MKKKGYVGFYLFLSVLVFGIAFVAINYSDVKTKLGFGKKLVEEVHVEAPAVIIPRRTLDIFRLKSELVDLIEEERSKNNVAADLINIPLLND